LSALRTRARTAMALVERFIDDEATDAAGCTDD
jgi:hypothetical protein